MNIWNRKMTAIRKVDLSSQLNEYRSSLYFMINTIKQIFKVGSIQPEALPDLLRDRGNLTISAITVIKCPHENIGTMNNSGDEIMFVR